MRVFEDRHEAGRLLAEELVAYADCHDVIVLGLARGGVPVAFEVARRLRAPLDVCTVRKLGVPGQKELAMGAVAAGGTIVVNRELVTSLRIPEEVIEAAAEREANEIVRRERMYREGRDRLNLRDQTVILVDDGLATGASMTAAVYAIRDDLPGRIVVAAPVGARSTVEGLQGEADDVICLEAPEAFSAVSQWYVDFSPTTDDEVRELVAGTSTTVVRAEGPLGPGEVLIRSGEVSLRGELMVPADAYGVVLFAHGAGSSRKSARNQSVARSLRGQGLGTLLLDLLTADEEANDAVKGARRFDVDLLARRLVDATAWIAEQPSTRALPLGYFGASTGAAAALVAAVKSPAAVRAIVARGGRPDLARPLLARVQAPTLLIVGGADALVLEQNIEALDELRADKRLEVIPDATHLFEEPGALERVAELAGAWFELHLASGPKPAATRRSTTARPASGNSH